MNSKKLMCFVQHTYPNLNQYTSSYIILKIIILLYTCWRFGGVYYISDNNNMKNFSTTHVHAGW